LAAVIRLESISVKASVVRQLNSIERQAAVNKGMATNE